MTSLNVIVVLKINALKGSRLSTFAQHIYDSLNANPNFPGIYPGIGILQRVITALNTAIAGQRKGDKATTQAVKDAEKQVRRVLKVLAAVVEYISDNNATVALTSGFSLRTHTPKTQNDFSAVHGLLAGEVDVKSKAFTDGSYIFQYTTTPLNATSWQTASTKKQVKHTITGLTPGVMYWFRVIVVTRTGQQPPSTPVNLMVV
ncbi:MAG: fibronectin type III domain-containing protein [Bacteroidia bacterium]